MELLKILLILIACVFMYLGGQIDKKERKYPNVIVILTTLLGLGVAFLNERLLFASVLCIVFHTIGVFDGLFLKLMKPGDWKMFATLTLYLPLENTQIFTTFAVILIFITIFTKIKSLRVLNWKNLRQSMKAEKDALKTLFVLREHLIPDKETLDLFKSETIPMTALFFTAYFFTQLLFLI